MEMLMKCELRYDEENGLMKWNGMKWNGMKWNGIE
jgi:hypothetical protein